jgi:hypothetical protein
LVVYEKEVYYSDVKIFNNLPADIKNTSGNLKRFKKFKTYFDYTLFLQFVGILFQMNHVVDDSI